MYRGISSLPVSIVRLPSGNPASKELVSMASQKEQEEQEEKRKIPTGIPLEQLIPAPLIVTIRLALAIAVDTSESWRRAEKSVWSVEDKRWSRRSEGGIVFRKGGRGDKPPVVYVTGCQPRRERERGKCEQARGRRRSKERRGEQK